MNMTSTTVARRLLLHRTLIIKIFLLISLLLNVKWLSADPQVMELSELVQMIDKASDLSISNPQQGKIFAIRAAEQCRMLDNDTLLAEAYYVLGNCYINIGNNDSSMYFARIALSLNKGEHTRFLVNNLLGRLHHEFQSFDSAIYFFETNLLIGEKKGSKDWAAATHNNLGMVFDSKGDLRKAFDHYSEALILYEMSKNLKNAAIVLNNLGIINQNLGELEKSIEYFERAIIINKELNALVDLSMNYNNLGTIYKDLNRLDEALEMYKASLNIAVENNLSRDQARIHLNLGNIFKKRGNMEMAELSYKESMKICVENNILFGVMLNYYALGSLYTDNQQYAKAEPQLVNALNIALQSGHQITLLDTYRDLSLVYEKLGKPLKALEFSRKLMHMNDSINEFNHRQYVMDIQTRYETERKELENISLKKENENKSKTIRLQFYLGMFSGLAILLLILLVVIVLKSRTRFRKSNERLVLLNEKFQIQNAELEETISTKDKLFSLIAHDLRSPFSSMLGFLQLLAEDFDATPDDEKKRILEGLYKQSSNTYSLIENLMTWAMDQRGQLQYRPGYYDLKDIAAEEIAFLASRADNKSITVQNEIANDLTGYVDKDMARVIFRNLINNAIKFTEENGRIVLTADKQPDFTAVSITDNGRGMTAEEVDMVICNNTFYTSKGTKDEKGTGLGLLIVKEFAEKNNIRLEISSNPNQGTRFTLHIPVHE